MIGCHASACSVMAGVCSVLRVTGFSVFLGLGFVEYSDFLGALEQHKEKRRLQHQFWNRVMNYLTSKVKSTARRLALQSSKVPPRIPCARNATRRDSGLHSRLSCAIRSQKSPQKTTANGAI